MGVEVLRSLVALSCCYWALGAVQREHQAVEKQAELTAQVAVAEDQALRAKAESEECQEMLSKAADVMQVFRDRLKTCYSGAYK